MLWVIVCVAILLVGLGVTVALGLRLWRKAKALLTEVEGLATHVSDAMAMLDDVSERAELALDTDAANAGRSALANQA